jgi:hypothetical protein
MIAFNFSYFKVLRISNQAYIRFYFIIFLLQLEKEREKKKESTNNKYLL